MGLGSLNDNFTVLTMIIRKQYILQHQNSQKYGKFQPHTNNPFKLFDNSFPSKLYCWKLMYEIRMNANAIQVNKCLMYKVSVDNIVWQ